MSGRVVGVVIDGAIEWHAANLSGTDHDTLCGVDAHDPQIGHMGTAPTWPGQKITCAQCHGIWRAVVKLRLRESMFDLP